MPLQFWWMPNNTPVATASNRVDIGLEVGGDDNRVGSLTPGRVKIFEIGGSGAGVGTSETRDRRLIATFHGNFHRNPRSQVSQRITFEIFGIAATSPHSGVVNGFDPECVLGVDAFVVTFVNREFRINLPFLLDTRSEGDFLEIEALGEIDFGQPASPVVMGSSAALRLRIRRTHEVVTTSNSGSSPMRYTGRVIGNLILHHEDYLTQGAFKPANAAWPPTVNSQFIPVPWTGNTSIPFQSYTSGAMHIVLMNDLLNGLLPGPQYFTDNVTGVADGQAALNQARARARDGVRASLNRIFADAGFTQPAILWEDENAAAPRVTALTAAFTRPRRHNDSWVLRNPQSPFQTSFWDYYVTNDENIQSVGQGERMVADITSIRGNREYLLPCPVPIGSGDKKIEAPIKIKAGYFQSRIAGRPGSLTRYPSMNELYSGVDAASAKLAICISHEVAHSLGMMHEMLIKNSGPYSENEGSPVLTIMCSSIDQSSFGIDMVFSNQAKVIWQRAFGLQPNYNTSYLQNKTWNSSEYRTVSWGDRNNRFFRIHREIAMSYPYLGTNPDPAGDPDRPPTYARSPPDAPQRGTYVPPQNP